MSGRYKILDHLGAGGVGAVYKAYDTQLDRYVAIKRLLSKEEAERSDTSTSMLKKEAASLATMQHPNIVSIYDLAGDEEGMFIVMELLEGDNLSDWLERSPLELVDFKEFAMQTLEGILSAHQLNVLHRDLKPENIKMARLPGGRLQAKIVDFGLARMSYAARKQSEDQSGHVLGSIYYMAPEQFLRRPLDGRTDLYSLGCVFFQSLSGQRPFQGRTVKDVMDGHLHHNVHDLKELCPHLPGPICEWVMWMINAEQVYRPANAQAALDHLRALIDAGWFQVDAQQPVYAQAVDLPASMYQRPSTNTTSGVRAATGAQAPARTTSFAPRPVFRPPGMSTGQVPAQFNAPPGEEGVMEVIPEGEEGYEYPAPPAKKSLLWLYITLGVIVLGGGGWMFFKPKAAVVADAAKEAELPGGLPVQPANLLAKGVVLHYRAGVKTETYADPGQPTKDVQPGEIVQYIHDLEPRGGDTTLLAIEHRKDMSPKYSYGKPETFRVHVGMLQFDFGDGMATRVDKNRGEAKELPFGDPNSKTKGMTFEILVRPRIADKEVRIIQFRNQDDRGELTLKAYPNNEFHVFARTRGKDNQDVIKEGKIGGRNTKWFNIVCVSWDAAANRITMAVRGQDGEHSVGSCEAPKDCPVLNEIHISDITRDQKNPVKPEDKFTGDIVELAVWPFPMSSDDRSLQDHQLAKFYFSKPGSQYN